MLRKILAALPALALLGAGAFFYQNPCAVDSFICTRYEIQQAQLQDAANPHYMSFQTPWLKQTAHILYPAYAMKKNYEGSVVLKLTVGEDGKLLEKQVQDSSGHAELDESALHAADSFIFNTEGFGQVQYPYVKTLKVTFKP
jgi:TonB family protein